MKDKKSIESIRIKSEVVAIYDRNKRQILENYFNKILIE